MTAHQKCQLVAIWLGLDSCPRTDASRGAESAKGVPLLGLGLNDNTFFTRFRLLPCTKLLATNGQTHVGMQCTWSSAELTADELYTAIGVGICTTRSPFQATCCCEFPALWPVSRPRPANLPSTKPKEPHGVVARRMYQAATSTQEQHYPTPDIHAAAFQGGTAGISCAAPQRKMC